MNEKKIVGLIAAIQFVNVLDFMMVMPMGPDFAQALGIPTHNLGLIGGSYTFAAGIAGVVGSLFLDRFDRRKALLVALLGLAAGTMMGGLATSFTTLMLARIVAGCFGGPATSLALSVIADVVPPARRGRAMGIAMGAFSVASVFGVPAGLELARLGGWRLPFFAVGSLCVVISLISLSLLPPMTGHLKERKTSGTGAPFMRTEIALSYLAMGLTMLGAFMLIPNLSAFYQFNLDYPREHLGLLYMVGGVTSFFVMQIAGRMVDRFSSFSVVVAGTIWFVTLLAFGYIHEPPMFPTLVLFVGFMLGMSVRNIGATSLTTRVPFPNERARYMSFQSAVQHFSCAAGATSSSWLLTESAGGALQGMPRLATITLVLALPIPFLIRAVEQRVRTRERAPMTEVPAADPQPVG